MASTKHLVLESQSRELQSIEGKLKSPTIRLLSSQFKIKLVRSSLLNKVEFGDLYIRYKLISTSFFGESTLNEQY